jgi:hypothetical protein
VLEAIGVITIVLLIAREFLALESGPAPRLVARLVGWAALPFLFLFGVLVVWRVWGYLSSGA